MRKQLQLKKNSFHKCNVFIATLLFQTIILMQEAIMLPYTCQYCKKSCFG